MPPKQNGSKQQGVGARCSLMLQYLHPKQTIDQVIPPNSHEQKQQLYDCVVVSRETKSIKKTQNFVSL
jgi:hypothetical protein